MKYYSTVKNNDGIISLTGKWMEMEILILSKISQTQKDKCSMFLLYVESSLFKNEMEVEGGLFGKRKG
jgi:hypothetical protein